MQQNNTTKGVTVKTLQERRAEIARRIIKESRQMTIEQHRARLAENVELLRGPRSIRLTANGITTLLEVL